MTFGRLVWESLSYHWKSHLAVLLCVAAGTTVLGGALIVGDSMRGSLHDLTLDRLGRVDVALQADRYFRQAVADELNEHVQESAGNSIPGLLSRDIRVEPAIHVRGSMALVNDAGQETTRASRIQVWGVTAAFWGLARHGQSGSGAIPAEVKGAIEDSVILSEKLAREISATTGDVVLLKVQMPSDIPREAVLGRKDDLVRTLRMKVAGIVGAQKMGAFGLEATQRSPLNAFVALGSLQESLRIGDRINVLLVAGLSTPEAENSPAVHQLRDALASRIRLDDLGVRLRKDRQHGFVAVESNRMLLEPALADAAEATAGELRAPYAPTLTYLANSISLHRPSATSDLQQDAGLPRPEIPYSVVAAVPLDGTGPFAMPRTESGELVTDLAPDEILVNRWAADDLGAKPGDLVELTYFLAEPSAPFETSSATFRVRGVVPMQGAAADAGLVPEYPGITDARTYSDWDPPFPMDLRRVRARDDEYWDQFRATPKAFVSLDAGKRLWASRFGGLTSVRIALPTTVIEGAVDRSVAPDGTREAYLQRFCQEIEERLLAHFTPERVGLSFQPVKAQGLAAVRGGTDFAGLFLAFSFFLIGSAAILIGLVYRLGVERRAKQVGLLLAMGFDPPQVRRHLLAEGFATAAAGCVLGLLGALGYAWLVMTGLRTWWYPAVGTSQLALHVRTLTLALGAMAGLILASVTIRISLRGLVRLSPRALMAGFVTEPKEARTAGSKKSVLAMLVATVVLFAFGFFSISPVFFFLTGSVLLIMLLWCVAGSGELGDSRLLHAGGPWAIAGLGVRNAYRNRSRSVLTIGLVAFATFVIGAVGANRQAESDTHERPSGARMYMAEASVPLLHDLNTSAGRRELGLSGESSMWMSNVGVSPFRVKEGEDASCLNLYGPKRPRILGVTEQAFDQHQFALSSSLASAQGRVGTWAILKQDFGSNVIPAIGDANSVRWILHLGLGDRLSIVAEDGRTVELKIVGLLERSIFQSELLISETNFRKLFPSQAGHSFFLIEDGDRQAAFPGLLEQHLSDFGFDVTPVTDRLAEYHAVENTYLATFQMLGGLGLTLGTVGLGAVLLRGVMERRGELALLQAVGLRPWVLAWLVLSETLFLLVVGLGIGSISAAAAVAPHLVQSANQVPWLSLAKTMLLVLLVGLLSSLVAVRASLRTDLLPALRSE